MLKKRKSKKNKIMELEADKIYHHKNLSAVSKKYCIVFHVTPMTKIIDKVEVISTHKLRVEAVPVLTYIHSCYLLPKKAKRVLEGIPDMIGKKVKFK